MNKFALQHSIRAKHRSFLNASFRKFLNAFLQRPIVKPIGMSLALILHNPIRDVGLLESAIARPFQTFEEKDFYPTFFEKAAALGESLILNHPFIDGNKRTGMAAMYALLLENNSRIIADADELYSFIMSISNGTIEYEQIVTWLKENSASF